MNESRIIAGTMKWGAWGKKLSVLEQSSLIEHFLALGIKNHEDFNPRILAVRMWQEDRVVIR